jgi:hypothetical protein
LDEITHAELHDQNILLALNERLGMNNFECSNYPEFEMAVLVGRLLAVNNFDLNDSFPIRETCQMVVRHLDKYGKQYHYAYRTPSLNPSSSASVSTDKPGTVVNDMDKADEEGYSKMLDFNTL